MMILLEENVSTLLHAVLILIIDHDLPCVLTCFRFSHHRRFWVKCSFPSYLFFSLVMHESPLTEEISMQSSLDTRISMLLPPVLAQSAFALPKKINTLAQIKAFEVFGFRCIVTGPRGCSEAMQLSSIRPVRSDGSSGI